MVSLPETRPDLFWGASNNGKPFLGLSGTINSEGRDLFKESDHGQCRGQESTEVQVRLGLHVREFTLDLGKDQKAAPALALEVPLT